MTRTHISFDLETMSTESDAAIVQIGATVVGSPNKSFNLHIDPRTSESIGAHVDAGTMQWWNKQDPELRKRVFGGTTPIRSALDEFHGWCFEQSSGDMNRIYLWSKGADFDCVVLKNNYELYRTYPFNFRNHRCVRTIMDLLTPEQIEEITKTFYANNPTAQKHDALSDAQLQAKFIHRALDYYPT